MNGTVFTNHSILFEWYDHVLFSILLLMSTAIGIYFSCKTGEKMNTTDEYFMGGKKMTVGPIVMSLVASHVSSVVLISVPADVYQYGFMYALSGIGIFFVAFMTNYLFLPVFHELQLRSTYEYLELRFNGTVRTFCSVLFVMNATFFLGIVVYIPALIYSHAADISIYYIIPAICAVCTFYTTIGGLKAVVWTDTLQFSITCSAVIIVFVLGLWRAGGISNVLRIAYEGDRLTLDYSYDLTHRETVCSVIIYWFLNHVRMTSTSQECVLKFLSLPTLGEARKAVFWFCIGCIIVKTINVFTGLIMYTIYEGCDPLSSGQVTKVDELVPFYVADVASGIPGLTGLFISGVFCTALSTLSAAMNALSATIYQDIIVKSTKTVSPTNQKRTGVIMKLLVVIMGVIITSISLVVHKLGSILQLAISIAGIYSGSFIGLFSLGMLCPFANTKGAFWGMLTSSGFLACIFIGAQWYKATGILVHTPKYLSTDKCTFPIPIKDVVNSTLTTSPDQIFYLFRIGHYNYSIIGFTICILVGICVSFLTKSRKDDVDRRLLSPIIRYFIKDQKKDDDYYSIEMANEKLFMTNVI